MIHSAAATAVFQQRSELFIQLCIQDHESAVDQVLDR